MSENNYHECKIIHCRDCIHAQPKYNVFDVYNYYCALRNRAAVSRYGACDSAEESIVEKKINHEYTEMPTCPNCGEAHHVCSMDFEKTLEDAIITCSACGSVYWIHEHTITTYSTVLRCKGGGDE